MDCAVCPAIAVNDMIKLCSARSSVGRQVTTLALGLSPKILEPEKLVENERKSSGSLSNGKVEVQARRAFQAWDAQQG